MRKLPYVNDSRTNDPYIFRGETDLETWTLRITRARVPNAKPAISLYLDGGFLKCFLHEDELADLIDLLSEGRAAITLSKGTP